MMSQIIGIYDDGFTKDARGRNVAAIRFKIVTREGTPDDLVGHCLPAYKDAVVKSLRRLVFQNDKKSSQDQTKTPSSASSQEDNYK